MPTTFFDSNLSRMDAFDIAFDGEQTVMVNGDIATDLAVTPDSMEEGWTHREVHLAW